MIMFIVLFFINFRIKIVDWFAGLAFQLIDVLVLKDDLMLGVGNIGLSQLDLILLIL